jgi:hypothetical protein
VGGVTLAGKWLDVIVSWSTVLSSVGTLVALGVAIEAYRIAKRQGVEARLMVARERRATFELEILRTLLASSNSHIEATSPWVAVSLSCLPADELPLWRLISDNHMAGTLSSDLLRAEAVRRQGKADGGWSRAITLEMGKEVRMAIARRMSM